MPIVEDCIKNYSHSDEKLEGDIAPLVARNEVIGVKWNCPSVGQYVNQQAVVVDGNYVFRCSHLCRFKRRVSHYEGGVPIYE